MWCFFFLRRTPPKSCPMKLVPHFLFKVDGSGAGIIITINATVTLTFPHHVVEFSFQFLPCGPAFSRAQQILLILLLLPQMSLLPSQNLLAKPSGNLIKGQNKQLHNTTWTAATHRRTLRRGDTHYFPAFFPFSGHLRVLRYRKRCCPPFLRQCSRQVTSHGWPKGM